MKKSGSSKTELRRDAEDKLSKQNETIQLLKKADSLRLIHELQVHQIELEIQNEELMQVRAEMEEAYRQYTDLYDFAPVGYFTLARDGTVLKVNLAGANILGVERVKLINQHLGLFVSEESRFAFNTLLEKLLSGQSREISEMAFLKNGSGQVWVRIEASCFEGGQESRAVMMDISERRQMELALQESENRFRTTLQDIPSMAVQGYGMDGKTSYWNSASERLYGYSAQEALGQNLMDLIIPPEIRDGMWRDIQQMAATGQPIPAAELSLMRKDGSRVPVFSSHSIASNPGHESEFFCLDIDLTERKRTEEALMRSERKYRLLHESMIDGFVSADMNGNFLEFNKVYRNMLGYSEAEFAQLTHMDITPEKWHAIEADILENQIIKRGYSDIYEKEYIRKDGTIFPVELRSVLLRDEQGKPVGMWAIVRDITERKQAEKALGESQELFSLFMHHSPIYTFIKEVTPTESRVLQASDNFQEMIGIQGRDMVGKIMTELFPPEFAAKITADDWSVISNGETLKLDENFNGRNYISIKFPIIQGDKILLAGYTIDITERVHAENDLRRARESLTRVNIELQTALTREKQLAHTDVLTSVNNRRYLFELAEHEFDVAERYKRPLSVVMFDIDHFKNVNDTFGHTVGDQILELVAQVARGELRSADVIGRYGGEEFVIVLPMTNAQQACQLAERIRTGVAEIRVPTEKGDAVVTISIGIVEMIHGLQTESIEHLIRRADEAMYAAKQAGRNRTEIGK